MAAQKRVIVMTTRILQHALRRWGKGGMSVERTSRNLCAAGEEPVDVGRVYVIPADLETFMGSFARWTISPARMREVWCVEVCGQSSC